MPSTPLVFLSLLAVAASASAQAPVDANHAAGAPDEVFASSAPGAGARAGASDDFNRANSTNMGPDWVEHAGDLVIDNQLGRGDLSSGWSYMLHNSASGNPADETMWVDLAPPTGSSGPHVALICGAATGSTSWFYTKIQDNDGNGLYDRIFFYQAGNGSGWGTSYYQDLSPQVASARVSMYFTNAGDTMNVDIDEDFDGVVDQHFENYGALAVAYAGTSYGIGAWAMGAFDNWSVGPAGPALEVRNLVAGATATIAVTNATPGTPVRHGFSVFGGGPVSTPYGDLLLTPPYTELPAMVADAAGAASYTGSVPVGTTGVLIWFHAMDMASLTFTNGVSQVIG